VVAPEVGHDLCQLVLGFGGAHHHELLKLTADLAEGPCLGIHPPDPLLRRHGAVGGGLTLFGAALLTTLV
jgi:hypothetical protein